MKFSTARKDIRIPRWMKTDPVNPGKSYKDYLLLEYGRRKAKAFALENHNMDIKQFDKSRSKSN